MGRRAAIVWHAVLSVAAGVLYFYFVLPRWPELTGDTSHDLGTAARIVGGVLIALAALPVVFALLRSRKPEFGTPVLALTLRTWSVVAHVSAGVLIVGTALSEIWLSLDRVGQWLFGVYGAAAAVALLGIAAFHLSFVAEQPPPPPKPLKQRKSKRQDRLRHATDADADGATVGDGDSEEAGADDTAGPAADQPDDAEETVVSEESPDAAITAGESTTGAAPSAAELADAESGRLRNRRPIGKGTHRRRSRRGVAVDE